MLEGLTPPVKESLCAVMQRAADLEPADLKILLDALQDVRWSNLALAKELTRRGFQASEGVVRKHRNKACCCVK
jgi:hypothetical protein